MLWTPSVGVSTSLAVKIYKKYCDDSIKTVRRCRAAAGPAAAFAASGAG
jgi:hypothetical protein